MSKRGKLVGWFRSFTRSAGKQKRLAAAKTHRRARLEQLERRYALTAPAVVPDYLFVEENATVGDGHFGDIHVLDNDASSSQSTLHVSSVTVNGTEYVVALNGGPYALNKGTLTLTADTFEFTPAPGASGNDSFSYKASDENGTSVDAPVSIDIVDSIPVLDTAPSFLGFVDEGSSLPLNATDYDVAGRFGSYSSLSWYVNSSLVTPVGGQTSWAALNAIGVVNGGTNALVTVKANDGRVAATNVAVNDVMPTGLLDPVAAGCSGNTVSFGGTFFDPNVRETEFTGILYWGDLDPDTFEPLSSGPLTFTSDGSGHFTIVPGPDTTHTYANGTYSPLLLLFAYGEVGVVQTLDGELVIPAAGGGGGADAEITGAPAGDVLPTLAIDLSNGGATCGTVSYAWTVTKDGSPFATGTDPTFSFTPDNVGTYEVALTVTGTAGSDTDTSTIHVVRSLSEGTTFMVGESNSADTVVLHSTDIPAGTQKVVIYAGAGNDDIQIPGSISVPVWLYGGPGNDRLKGGGGNDVIVGGEGDDLLMGGSGRDIIIGGGGADRIIGDAEDDILIGGRTAYDGNDAALALILAEWTTSSHTYTQRVANISNGVVGGVANKTANNLNGTYLTPDHTVVDDGAADVLTGSSGLDWFLLNSDGSESAKKDKATDVNAAEFSSDLDWINFNP